MGKHFYTDAERMNFVKKCHLYWRQVQSPRTAKDRNYKAFAISFEYGSKSSIGVFLMFSKTYLT